MFNFVFELLWVVFIKSILTFKLNYLQRLPIMGIDKKYCNLLHFWTVFREEVCLTKFSLLIRS